MEWRTIDSAPYSTPVKVKCGQGKAFMAELIPNGSMDENEMECDQWVACEGESFPPCWSGGACWESNADGVMSKQPTAWMPLPPPPTITGDE